MLVGYARVSTIDQNLDLQNDALRLAGCERIFTDTASGAKGARPGLAAALEFVRAGDVLVVWRLDRLGRSLSDLIVRVQGVQAKGVEFRSLQEAIDTTTANGRLIFHIMGALAEFERDLIEERSKAGRDAARARGRVGGRPKAMTAAKIKIAQALRDDPSQSVSEICRTLGVSSSTFYRWTKGSA